MIKTQDGEKSVASTGLAGAALGLAIPGTVALVNQLTGGFGGLGNGLFGGWNNWNRGGCGYGLNNLAGIVGAGEVTHDTRVIGALESELARVNSERYADHVGIQAFKEAKTMFEKAQEQTGANYKELAQFIAGLDKQIAVDREVTNCNFRFLDNKIDTTARSIIDYVKGHYVPGNLVMPLSSICPTPLAASTPVVFNPQVVTTTAATTEGEADVN